MESAFGIEHGEFSKAGFGGAFKASFDAAKAGQSIPGSGATQRAHNVGMAIGQGARKVAPWAGGAALGGGAMAIKRPKQPKPPQV
jgi:hypothetical protein